MVSYQPTSAKSAYQCVSKIYPSTGPSQFSCKRRKKKMIKDPDPARNTLTNSELDNFNREYPTKWELFWANWAGMRSSTTESPRRQGAIFVSSLPFRNSKASPFEKQMLTRAKPSWKAHKCKLKFLEIAREWEGWSMEKWKPTSLRNGTWLGQIAIP